MELEKIGWSEFFAHNFQQYAEQGFSPARITSLHANLYTAQSESGELEGKISGKFRFNARSQSDYPAVGDWVAVKRNADTRTMTIHGLLPRRTAFSRKQVSDTGITDVQIISANIDVIFIVNGLDLDFNIQRLERYIIAASDSGARAVIILNKSDLCSNVDFHLSQIRKLDAAIPVHVTSAVEGNGLEAVAEYLVPGMTITLVGSSGVGKSTIINALLGQEKQTTGEVRGHDSKGRHVTTHRELILLPNGAMVIDNPGMREMGMWGDENSLSTLFEDIEKLATQCKFRNCAHDTEPGCAIKSAIESGSLEPARLNDYRKLQKELRVLAVRKDQRSRMMDSKSRK
jgi:ribosome biogenesis GTPase